MCSTYFHRDQMAASNMVNVIDGHLDPGVLQLNGKPGRGHRRPVYLCQAAHRSEPNEDNLDDSGSEYSEDEDGESELEENDQEEEEDEDAGSNQFETDESDRDDDDDHLTDESEEEED
ncbi:hypothetical protein BGZ49_005068 [Haplosporangium sp. Z 27]|nr:hypothetical protein BGZ49_005068 [Haplosporangium sp. Z 27]